MRRILNYFGNLRLKEFYFLFSNKRYRTFYWLVFRYGSRKRYQPVKIHFGKYKLSIPDITSFIWQYKEIFADELYRFNAPEQPLIIDCGANVGTSCLYYKSLFPEARIIAFEPDSNIYQYLVSNLEANGAKDVEVHRKAVWINTQPISFSSEGADGGSILGAANSQLVECVRLRDELASHARVDFLKIDIEGAEVEVLKDCRNALDNVSNIFIEYHSYPGSPQELNAILEILTASSFRYFIEVVNIRKHPFINHSADKPMDMQANIFAYREVARS